MIALHVIAALDPPDTINIVVEATLYLVPLLPSSPGRSQKLPCLAGSHSQIAEAQGTSAHQI